MHPHWAYLEVKTKKKKLLNYYYEAYDNPLERIPPNCSVVSGNI